MNPHTRRRLRQQAEATRPTPADVWLLVMHDMEKRRVEGIRRYGVPVQPHNGRDALWDAFEEALDLAVYLRQAIAERDAAPATPEIPQEADDA